jgi:hypothetical protein
MLKKVKIIYTIDTAPNPKYCGYCIYKKNTCTLFNEKLEIVDNDCFLRCKSCLKGEIK